MTGVPFRLCRSEDSIPAPLLTRLSVAVATPIWTPVLISENTTCCLSAHVSPDVFGRSSWGSLAEDRHDPRVPSETRVCGCISNARSVR